MKKDAACVSMASVLTPRGRVLPCCWGLLVLAGGGGQASGGHGRRATGTSLNLTLTGAAPGPGITRDAPRLSQGTCALGLLPQRTVLHSFPVGDCTPLQPLLHWPLEMSHHLCSRQYHLLIFSSRPCPLDVKWWIWWNLPVACCLPSGLYQIQDSSSFHVWQTGRIYRNLYKHREKWRWVCHWPNQRWCVQRAVISPLVLWRLITWITALFPPPHNLF